MTKQKYFYSVIHFAHDAFSGERINVGVVVLSDSPRAVQVKIPSSVQRLKLAFPDCDTNTISIGLRALERRLHSFFEKNSSSQLGEALEFVLPLDDQSFMASKIGVGITNDVKVEAAFLLERFVTRYDIVFDDAEISRNINAQQNWKHIKLITQDAVASNDLLDKWCQSEDSGDSRLPSRVA